MSATAAEIKAVGKGRQAEDIPRLAQWLRSSPDDAARAQAALCLGWQRLPQSLPPLAEAACDDPDPTVRAAAMRALGGLKDPGAARVFPAAFADPDPLCRSLALRLAGLLGEAREVIAAALEEPTSPVPVAAEACVAAGRLDDPVHAPALWRVLAERPEEKVRRSAGIAWSRVAPQHPDSHERLARLLGDVDPEIRVAALGGLERLGVPGALGLIEPLLEDSHPAVKRVAEAISGRLAPNEGA